MRAEVGARKHASTAAAGGGGNDGYVLQADCLPVQTIINNPPAPRMARPQTTGDGRSRYCYAKIVRGDSNAHEMFHTYFWTADGQPIPLETVLGFRNFQAEPFVEVEEIFVSKAVRSLQLKLRECIVYPPTERPNTRSSVCFPERICSVASSMAALEPSPAATVSEPAFTHPPYAHGGCVPTTIVPIPEGVEEAAEPKVEVEEEEEEEEQVPAKRPRIDTQVAEDKTNGNSNDSGEEEEDEEEDK